MRKQSKILLTAAAVFIAAGLIISNSLVRDPKFAPLYAVLPLGAILFGLFLTSRLLDHESARYDEETAKARLAANVGGPSH